MPYTQEELKNLTFYKNLIDEDEQKYLTRKNLLTIRSNLSGSADNGELVYRDKSGAILVFENPYSNTLNKDSNTKVIYDGKLKLLKTTATDTIVDEVLDRNFEEL